MSTVHGEEALGAALNIMKNIESRYGRFADRLGDVHKFASSDHPNGFIGQ